MHEGTFATFYVITNIRVGYVLYVSYIAAIVHTKNTLLITSATHLARWSYLAYFKIPGEYFSSALIFSVPLQLENIKVNSFTITNFTFPILLRPFLVSLFSLPAASLTLSRQPLPSPDFLVLLLPIRLSPVRKSHCLIFSSYS